MQTLSIIVTRDVFTDAWTLSTVDLDLPEDGLGPLPFGFCVEDVDRRLEADPSRKIRGQTAIPVGTYEVRLYDSPKHGPMTPELMDVPGFQHVQIHSGNSAADTEGCLLFGLARDVEGGQVARSRAACSWLRSEIIRCINGGGTVTVEVRRAG